MTAISVPAGTYFLGDPCYAVPDEDWADLLVQTDFFHGSPSGVVRDHDVFAFSTLELGDGEYHDEHGHSYQVDSGLIGLTAAELANPTGAPEHAAWLESSGQIVTFTEPVEISREDYLLTFGPYRIDLAEDMDAEETCGDCGSELVLGLCAAYCDADLDEEDEGR
ncbi:hypothetical protein [Nocardioides pakistanensis]